MNRDDRFNCWEFMNCGREPGGDRVGELGVCPAAEDRSFDGLNRGRNAGRLCWAVAGTFCGGEVQGSFVEKRRSCMDCDFFQHVHREEGSGNGRTGFLEFLSDAQPAFLAQLTCRHDRAGERFITQGETDGTAYIIDRGACLAVVEKNGGLHPVGHRGEGDIVGDLALLTGEPQPAHVEAQTDATLWVLPRRAFEDLSKEDPDLLDFLTELTADRLDSRRPVADRRIGKYTATEIIGRGGYSIVYRGVHTGLDLPVAIKMMRHDMAADPDFLAGFRNEAKMIAALDHDNIVRVYDIEERFRTVFIIMEHVRGESLQSLLRRLKRLPPRLIVSFLLQICAGLAYAHRKGIIHRDIKPDNIIVGPDDRIKILDFGLACPPGADDCRIGTVFYLAPEQITGDRIDPRTDIYRLGVAAYEMAIGTRPFPGASAGSSSKPAAGTRPSATRPPPKPCPPSTPSPRRPRHRRPLHRPQNPKNDRPFPDLRRPPGRRVEPPAGGVFGKGG